jgi:O-antigen ligase
MPGKNDRFPLLQTLQPLRLKTGMNSLVSTPWGWVLLGLVCLPFSPALGLPCFVIALGWALKIYADRCRQRKLTWAWVGLSLLLIWSSSQAAFPLAAWLGLANFVPFFLLFVALREVIQTPHQLLTITRLIGLTVIPLVLLGTGSFLGWWHGPVQWGWIIQWSLALGGTPTGRMDSVFDYANVFASYLTIAFPLILGLWCQSWQRSNLKPWLGIQPDRCLWSISLGLVGLGLLLTHSRNAWMIATLVWFAFAFYQGWYRWLFVAVGLLSSIFWAAFGSVGRSFFRQWIPLFFWGRLNDQIYQNRPVTDLRLSQWQFAWDLTRQHPWFGWGFRNFSLLYQAETGAWLGHPHNFFLMMSAEAGIPSILCLGAIVAWILIRAIVLGQGILHPDSSPSPYRLTLFSTLLAIGASILFHCFDVTLFDARINLMNWLLLAALTGIETWTEDPLMPSDRQASPHQISPLSSDPN